MKKILLGLFALSAVSFAMDENIYLKIGGDLAGGYTAYKIDGETVLKKGGKGLGWEIALEATDQYTDNFEFGVGLGYQDHGKGKTGHLPDEYYPQFVDNIKFNGYYSGVLYFTGKYKFQPINNFTPYIKGNLGWSFNNTKNGSVKIDGWDYFDTQNGKTTAKKFSDSFNTKVKNGLYTGAGIGFEYNEIFTVDLMYQLNKAKLQIDIPDEDNNGNEFYEKYSSKYDYSRVTLSVGVKF